MNRHSVKLLGLSKICQFPKAAVCLWVPLLFNDFPKCQSSSSQPTSEQTGNLSPPVPPSLFNSYKWIWDKRIMLHQASDEVFFWYLALNLAYKSSPWTVGPDSRLLERCYKGLRVQQKRNLISINQRITCVNASFKRLVSISRCGRWVLCVCGCAWVCFPCYL